MELYKVYFSLVIFILSLGLFFYLARKYKLTKDQKLIFFILLFFWMSITLIRSYRKLYATTEIDLGGMGLTAIAAANIAAAYGLMSFIVRLPIFVVSDALNKRKIFVQGAMIISIITTLLVFIAPNYETLYASSLAIGVSGTMLAMFNVIFADNFDKKDSVISTSILTLAPLMSEFLSAPIQYIFTIDKVKNYNYIWLAACIVSIFTLILTFFMKDAKIENNSKLSIKKFKRVLSDKGFLIMCFLSVLIAFLKFATSGANMTYYGKTMFNMPPFMIAYMDLVFVVSQLIGGVLVGVYFNKKFGPKLSFIIYLVIAIGFYLTVLFSTNMYIVYVAYILNGFSFGGAYNLLVTYALRYFKKEDRNISMGVFQLFFGLGIYYGDKIYALIPKYIPNGFLGVNLTQSIFLITIIITIISILLTLIFVKMED